MNQDYESVRSMIYDLMDIYNDLSTQEWNFVNDMFALAADGEYFSDEQVETITRIWKEHSLKLL